MSQILYNNQNPFINAMGVPIVAYSRTQDYINGRLSDVDRFVLRGKIKSDCGTLTSLLAHEDSFIVLLENGNNLGLESDGSTITDSFYSLYSKQLDLINRFSTNFKSFEIRDDSNRMYYAENAIVRSIEFDESSYFNLIGYQIQIDVIRGGYADLGIVDPSENFTFADRQDASVQITHTVSCRAINLSSVNIENAKSFVSSKLGTLINPMSWGDYKKILISRSETINRLTGEVSATEVFEMNSTNNFSQFGSSGIQNGLLYFTTDVTKNDSTVEVAVRGQLKGPLNGNISDLRSNLQVIDFYSIAVSSLNFESIGIVIHDTPTGFSITEDTNNNVLTFSITFSNQVETGAFIIDRTTVSKDFASGVDCLSVEVEIRSGAKCQATRWSQIQEYNDSFDFDSYISSKWAQFGTSKKLSNVPDSRSISINELESVIRLSRRYCTNYKEDCDCMEQYTFSLNYDGGIPQYSRKPSLSGEGCYSIQNLGFNSRAKFKISGKFNVSKCCTKEQAIVQARSRANYYNNLYFLATDKVLEESSIDYEETLGTVGFSFTWNGISTVDLFADGFILIVDGTELLLEDGQEIELA